MRQVGKFISSIIRRLFCTNGQYMFFYGNGTWRKYSDLPHLTFNGQAFYGLKPPLFSDKDRVIVSSKLKQREVGRKQQMARSRQETKIEIRTARSRQEATNGTKSVGT